MRIGPISALMIVGLACSAMAASAGEPAPVRHPNLLLNQQEIDQIKQKIKTQPWAAELFEKLKAGADGVFVDRHDAARNAGLLYALTGEKRYADAARRRLIDEARYALPRYEKADLKVEPEFGAWSPWGANAWAYDLTYDTFSAEERALVERWLRTGCKTVIEGSKVFTTTPNLVFGKHFNVGLVGYCLGDKELIEWALRDSGGVHGPQRGGFYPVLDSMIKDTYFWGETPIYALHYDVHGMLALAEAALHYDGADLYGYVSKQSGGSIRGLLDGYLRLAYPLERTGIGKGSIRMATYGDGSTSYSPDGTLFDTYIINALAPSSRAPVLAGELEIAYKRYKDPAYAWMLSLNPKRDAYIAYGRAAWGYSALTHGEPLPADPAPPAAPSGVYPGQGFALLRADESPDYWKSGALAALVMQGKSIGHGHRDYYSLILHGKGRLLYPDLNVTQYESTYVGWTREGIAHSTLLVDRQSPSPGPFTTKHDFRDAVKYYAISGSAFEGVRQTRALLMAKEYLGDFFHAADTSEPARPRVFDWVLHGLGRLYPGNPAAYRPGHDLVPFYWWIDNERSRAVDATFRADWIQRTAGILPGRQPFGKKWFAQEVGVRMTMLGAPGTRVYAGDGPMCDGPPYHRLDGNPEGARPLVLARRAGPAATFAAVHEAYEGRPNIKQVQRLAETSRAVAVVVATPQFTDYLMAAFDDAEHVLTAADGQTVTFSDHGYVRLADGKLQACGRLKGFRLKQPAGKPVVEGSLDGQKVPLTSAAGLIQWGLSGAAGAPAGEGPRDAAPAAREEDPAERAGLHAWFDPEEVHLSAGAQKEVRVHLRRVGEGQVEGRFRVESPKGLRVEPGEIVVPPLAEGEERVVAVKVTAARDAARGLHSIRFVPEQGLPAAPVELLSAVGVVITEDRTIPMTAQFVVRAPGYTMKVDHTSGVSYYLLDGEGHRRHGRLRGTNFIQGIPGIELDGKWLYRFGTPCQFVWTGDNTLTVGCGAPYGDVAVRFRYTFHDDRIAIGLVPPTNPTKEFTVWLGNFDALEPPLHNGKQQAPHLPIVADRLFFPHPVHRQGLLLTTPPETPVTFRGTAFHLPLRHGQEVSLRFVDQAQAGLKE